MDEEGAGASRASGVELTGNTRENVLLISNEPNICGFGSQNFPLINKSGLILGLEHVIVVTAKQTVINVNICTYN